MTAEYAWVRVGPNRLRYQRVGKAFRKDDAHRIRSLASGILPTQIPDMMRRLDEKGLADCVEYDPTNGNAVYRDVAARDAVLKARGMFDRGR